MPSLVGSEMCIRYTSTGPHLHFGLYKNGRAIDPLKVVSVTKTKLVGAKRKNFMKIVRNMKEELDNSEKYANIPLKLQKFELSYKTI